MMLRVNGDLAATKKGVKIIIHEIDSLNKRITPDAI